LVYLTEAVVLPIRDDDDLGMVMVNDNNMVHVGEKN
jgi:hypothetical protein